jgi:hypothetical protein
MSSPQQGAAEDPSRYHPQSVIRQYLAAKPVQAATPEMLAAAVHERWAVKTAADAGAQALTSQIPTPTAIADLRALAVPAVLPPDGRSDGAETTVWQLACTLQAFRREADGDYHLVIADEQGRTMIAEIPNPRDITAPSFFSAQIANARAVFDTHFQITGDDSTPTSPAEPAAPADPAAAAEPGAAAQPAALADPAAAAEPGVLAASAPGVGAAFQQVSVPVTLTGIGYFDFNHGQAGVAPNAIELHPVIDIAFG